MTKDEESIGVILGYISAPFIGGLLLMWYNYVIIQFPVAYWQWVAISIALIVCRKVKLLKIISGLIFAAAVIGQTLHWINLVNLPLIPRP